MRIVLTWCGVVLLAACSDSAATGPEGMGTVAVRLADAPGDDFSTATIFVSRVYLVGQGAGAEEVLVSDTKASYDLLTLRDGVSTLMGTAEVEAQSYAQLRLVVDSAVVELVPGKTFADGSTRASLRVPSGSESGLKVNLSQPVSVEPSSTTTLLVDFSVDQSFILQGPRTAPTGVTFRPVLHAVDLGIAATILGSVAPLGVNGTVYAIRNSDTTQTTSVNGSGNFTLRFLPPGTYTVAAAAAGFGVVVAPPITVGAAEVRGGVSLTLSQLP